MARTDPPFKIRMPDELKARIEQAAISNRRSMNAEIVSRLDASFSQGSGEAWEAYVASFRRAAEAISKMDPAERVRLFAMPTVRNTDGSSR
jgi:hypothetical protein